VQYKTGPDLEEAIFGKRSGGLGLVKEFWWKLANFRSDVISVLGKSKAVHPDTIIGSVLYHQVVRQLSRHLDSKGLVFLSTVNTKVDARHYTDGLFYLSSLHSDLVTVDVFNISNEDLDWLREMWIDQFTGSFYSDSDFQSDLFRFKKGVSEWRKIPGNEYSKGSHKFIDFRQYTEENRPENHFVLTPSMIGTYEARRSFAKLVAGYFLKVSGQKMACNKA
jgi:hypothetical protein